MNNVSRVFATGFIWAALTILGVAMMVSSADISGGTLAFVMTVLIIGATVGTLGIWQSNSHQGDAKQESEKAKRRSRLERLMSDLDDRDIEELRSRLMLQDDDESIPLEELMRTSNRR